jgi:membrane-bound lytic murein transglycosylase B
MRFILATFTILLRRALPIMVLVLAIGQASGQSGETFDAFLAGLWKDAAAQGISRTTFDLAFAGITPDPRVLGAMQHAPEYGKPFGAYVESIVSPSRIALGLRKSALWADTLRRIETKYGVPASILVSIWGIESSFGDSSDRWDVLRCIATLAHAKIQQPYFRDELISALKILQSHAIARPQLLGSYAGAMGQAQFMPSSYLKYAVDFDGDGRADIWTSVPDVLASIANYLRQYGWQPGLPWGFEVLAPLKFDYGVSRGTFREWHARGFERLDGGRWPDTGDAILFFPSGAPGPAFLVTQNFVVLKTYNNSDAYALAVAHLADRLNGAGRFRSAWPINDVQPSRSERIALQKKLSSLGYKVADFDGHIDFDLRDDIRKLQLSYGMTPDGHPSRAFLDRLGLLVP